MSFTYKKEMFPAQKEGVCEKDMESIEAKKGIVITIIIIIMVFFALGASTSGCVRPLAQGKVKVLATIFPVADIASLVGGERVEVITLLPPGASPHTYEPLPSQVEELSKARLCVRVGLGLDFWLDKLVASAGNKDLKIITLGDNLPPHLLIPGQEEHGEDHRLQEPGESDYNPHIWLDPIIAMEIAGQISQALSDVDAEGSPEYEKNTRAYLAELEELAMEVSGLEKKVTHKDVVTFHSAFTYLLRRAGLRQAAVIEEFPGKEPSPHYIEEVVSTIKSQKVPVVFGEPQFNPKVAQMISAESGVTFAILDPLGDPGNPERDSYLNIIRYNLNTLEEYLR